MKRPLLLNPGPVTLSEYLSYFRIFWLQTLVPSLASVTIPAFKLSTLQIVFVVVSQIAVLSCVVVSVRRKRSAWRAWIFFAVIVGIGVWLVNALVDARKADECIAQGRRNCNPIDAPPTQRN